MNNKTGAGSIFQYVQIAAVLIWVFGRASLAAAYPAVLPAFDIIIAWVVAPMFLHAICVMLLSRGLECSALEQKISYNFGLAFARLGCILDRINGIVPGNPIAGGAQDRKVLVGCFLSALERKADAKKYFAKLGRELKSRNDNNSVDAYIHCNMFLMEIIAEEGNYEEARRLANDSLAVIDTAHCQPVSKGGILTDLCATYIKQGLIEESISVGKRAVEAYDPMDPTHNQLQAIAYNNLSLAYSYAGEYVEALAGARRSLNLKKAVATNHQGGPAGANFSEAIAHSNIADYLLYLDRFDEALVEANEALKILDTLGFTDGSIRGTILQNVGSAHLGLGHVEEAKKFLLNSLSIKDKHMSKKDPEWSSVYLDLGRLYAALKDGSKADQYFQKAVDMAKKCLGDKHPRLAYSYVQYAKYLGSVDRELEAGRLRKEAQEIDEHWGMLRGLR